MVTNHDLYPDLKLPHFCRYPITGSVGHLGQNHPGDVEQIKRMLNNLCDVLHLYGPALMGMYLADTPAKKLINPIMEFQSRFCNIKNPDGLIYPHKKTYRLLLTMMADRTWLDYIQSIQEAFAKTMAYYSPIDRIMHDGITALEHKAEKSFSEIFDLVKKSGANYLSSHFASVSNYLKSLIAATSYQLPEPNTNASKLTNDDYTAAAQDLKVEAAVIKAISEKESGSFDALGRPGIMYEGHIFAEGTNHEFDNTHPEISYFYPHADDIIDSENRNAIIAFFDNHSNPKNEVTDPALGTSSNAAYVSHIMTQHHNKIPGSQYNNSNAAQFEKLNKAILLNVDEALKACSWGLFQVMGENYDKNVFPNVREFVKAMYQSENEHLKAFKYFIRNTPGLLKDMQDKNWHKIAHKYNGSKSSANNYAEDLEDSYGDFIDNPSKMPKSKIIG